MLYCARLFTPEPERGMLEITEEIPFLWRLSTDNDEGFSIVSMVVPFNFGNENREHTIQTDVVSFTGDHEQLEAEEILEWNDEDISLFLKLLATRDVVKSSGQSQTFRVDLSDPETIEIVHIVAAAGFGMALAVDDLLVSDPGNAAGAVVKHEVGARITLQTVDGFKRGVVVASDDEEEEVVCVLLDPIKLDFQTDLSDIHTHDLVVVKMHQLLPARYSSQIPSASDVLH
jgi:hypothetical protein